MAIEGKIGLAGGGNMGSALLKGMLAAGAVRADQVVVAEKLAATAQALSEELGVETVSDAADLSGLSLLILAVKPADVPAVTQAAAGALSPESLVITLAAGVKRSTVAAALPQDQPLVRAMPNTPALIQKGATAISGDGVAANYMDIARQVFEAVGVVVQVPEKLMDAVTALSGSGPAYVFVIIEALADAGVRQGLDRQTAMTLAAHTVAGAAEMLIATGRHPGELKDLVSSPGGTTICALHELERGGLRGVLINAVDAATCRGKELGGD